MKKKLIIIIFSILFVIIISCLPYWINDSACSKYRNQIEDSLSKHSDINVLQLVSGCGNSSGTGNHTDLYVAVLIETSLTDSDIKNKIQYISKVSNVLKNGFSTLAMEIMNLKFKEEKLKDNQHYYILEFSKESPCSILDIRGH